MIRKKYFTLFTLLLLAAVWLTGCTGSKQPPSNNPSTSPSVTEPTLTGGELAAARCAECHTLDRLTSQPRDDAEWRQVAERMLEKSPDLLTPAEFELVVAYLLEQDH